MRLNVRDFGHPFALMLGLLLTITASARVIPAQTGTVTGKVSKKKQQPSDPDRPLLGAKVFVEIGVDENGQPKLEAVARSEPNGVYIFDYAPGLKKLVIHKLPFYGPPQNREVQIRRGKKTRTPTTYLDYGVKNVQIALKARDELNAGAVAADVQKQLGPLLVACEGEENEECDLVEAATSALASGDIASAKTALTALGNLLEVPNTQAPSFSFSKTQSVYIVAFRTRHLPATGRGIDSHVGGGDFVDPALAAESKFRKKMEEWKFFKVVDKPSAADFIFLINIDEKTVEGLAMPLDVYQNYFKDDFDLDALREGAYGRYLAGPLRIATISRLTDRLARKFQQQVSPQ